jgi:hypothetical protein
MRWLVLVGAAVASVALLAQTAPAPGARVDLAAPALKANASVTQNNQGAMPVVQSLLEARASLTAIGLPWKGLDHSVTDGTGVSAGGFSVLAVYQKRACLADAIVVGRASGSVSHLSALGTAVYSDYDFSVDGLLKDNRASSIQSKPDIVVTRPGGSLELPEGHVSFEFDAFPRFQTGASYLLFLRYIPQSSSYEAVDAFSTLVATGNNWVIARKAFSRITGPELSRAALEASVASWLTSCK